MQFGMEMFPTDYAIGVVELGRALEDSGFESLWLPEHSHTPTSRRSPYPGGGELPREYSHTLDPFVALAAVAATTSTLKLATGICLVIQRDPIHLAKEVASLDHLSNGRVLLGIGGGWNEEEMADHGTDPATRWKVLRERIGALKALWTQEVAEYHGEFVNFGPTWQWPKPVQQPHPPIIVGGGGPHTLQRVLEYGDGWIPIGGRDDALGQRIAELNRVAAERGREPYPVSVFGAPADAAAIERYQSIGVTRCVFGLPPAPADVVLPTIVRRAALIKQFS